MQAPAGSRCHSRGSACAPTSDLTLAMFGPEIGRHVRSAIGVAGLHFNITVEIEREVLLREQENGAAA